MMMKNMACSRLVFASTLVVVLLVANMASGQRSGGREVRRRNRVTTTTTTAVPPTSSTTPEPAEVGQEKQSCEGEPGCTWRCGRQLNDPSAPCTCQCAQPPNRNNQEEGTVFDNSYFNK